jgi:hypothetical protein
MKKAIYLLLVVAMCAACTRKDHELSPKELDVQFSADNPIRVCTFQQGHYQALWGEATLKQMFYPTPVNEIQEIEFSMIDGAHYMEAVLPTGRLYIDLLPSGVDNGLILGTRMKGCDSGGLCKSCKYTGGINCGCGNGTNDCDYSQMTVTWE